ncbi:MAG: hypothetical protein WC967_11195 [Balneolaceae bacterium]
MGITVGKNLVHWNYFLAIEQDLAQVSRFIEFNENNFKCYSIELAHLLLASTSEVDVVLKALCNLFDNEMKHENINDYRKTIVKYLPHFHEEFCMLNRYSLKLNPWSSWDKNSSPLWWKANNNVKHHRDEKFNEANLKNTLNSIAGLHVCVLYYYKKLFEMTENNVLSMKKVTFRLNPEPSLIHVGEDYYYNTLVG